MSYPRAVLPLLLLLACNPAPPPAAELPYGDTTVAATLDQLLAAEARRAEADQAEPQDAVSADRVLALEERVALLELRIAELDTTGILPAAQIGYDPRKTTLGAQDLQTAVDELYSRVKTLEEGAEPGMGSPGPGMFTQPGRGGPPGATMGPPDGAQGPPGGGRPPGAAPPSQQP